MSEGQQLRNLNFSNDFPIRKLAMTQIWINNGMCFETLRPTEAVHPLDGTVDGY